MKKKLFSKKFSDFNQNRLKRSDFNQNRLKRSDDSKTYISIGVDA
jgi:hypothetical protein